MTETTPVFIHIPKTAGITLHCIVEQQYKGEKSFTAMQPIDLKRYIALPLETKQKIKTIKGHIHFGIDKYCPNPVEYYTVLRKPVNRAISQYHFMMKTRRDMKLGKYTLKETLEKAVGLNMDNGQVRFLCGVADIPYGGVTEEHLQLALHNLRTRTAVVGIMESFDASVLLFARKFNWSTPFYIKNNVTPASKAKALHIDAETQALLEQYNRYDEQLYKAALEIFETQLQQAGPQFKDELAAFVEENAQRGFKNKIENYYSFALFFFNRYNAKNLFFNSIRRLKIAVWSYYMKLKGKPIN